MEKILFQCNTQNKYFAVLKTDNQKVKSKLDIIFSNEKEMECNKKKAKSFQKKIANKMLSLKNGDIDTIKYVKYQNLEILIRRTGHVRWENIVPIVKETIKAICKKELELEAVFE